MVEFVSDNVAAIAIVLAGLCLLTIVMVEAMQVGRLALRINMLTGGAEGGDLEAVLGEHLETVHQVGRDLDELTARVAVIESSARHHFAREGLIRFNPFPDTGGNQSFALALLDESDDGVVVSSLHSRTGTRIYAKAVIGGKADTSLSTEEQEAIDEARSKHLPRPTVSPRSAAASRVTPELEAYPEPVPAPRITRSAAPAAAPVVARTSAGTAAKATRTALVVEDDETSSRPSGGRTKGQEKPRDLAPSEAETGVDSEKVHRKPGQPAPR